MDRAYIARYNLVKKDPTAALSEPVKPIVYYISREVPEKWRPFMKKGVEDWNEAYEQAGFKNAIICKEAPSEKEDPNWDPEDVRYSVIRWAPQAVSNAQGPHVHDPRSGEILSAHIIMWHDVLKLAQTWYFVQCAPLDVKAHKLPFADDLMGELLRYVVAHEVGHTLGLRHNHKASSFYTVAQLRSKEFTEKNGNEASIMDYGRFNYVAQPGDNARLIPKLGRMTNGRFGGAIVRCPKPNRRGMSRSPTSGRHSRFRTRCSASTTTTTQPTRRRYPKLSGRRCGRSLELWHCESQTNDGPSHEGDDETW